jgi:hypothetical protein
VKLPFRSALLVTMVAATEVACSVLTDLGPKKEVPDGGLSGGIASSGANDGGVPSPLQALQVAVGPKQACAIVAAGTFAAGGPTAAASSEVIQCASRCPQRRCPSPGFRLR